MKTIEITTTEIKQVLKITFNKVKKLKAIDLDIIENSTQARVVNVRECKGLKLIVGVYTYNTEEEIERDGYNIEFTRFVILQPVNKAYTF